MHSRRTCAQRWRCCCRASAGDGSSWRLPSSGQRAPAAVVLSIRQAQLGAIDPSAAAELFNVSGRDRLPVASASSSPILHDVIPYGKRDFSWPF